MNTNRKRVIPILLLQDGGLVKTTKFKKPVYVGDPINAVKIFNDKEVDELIFLDITATRAGTGIPYKKIEEIASECFMPVCYGGGITNIDEIRKILYLGIEKVAINSAAANNMRFVEDASKEFGASTVVVSVDIAKNFWGKYEVVISGGTKAISTDIFRYVKQIEEAGAGEILINSVDRDGLMKGYDLELIKKVTSIVNIPVVAAGGAGTVQDFSLAVQNGASAIAAGSMFVFKGKHRAVLINYPNYETLNTIF